MLVPMRELLDAAEKGNYAVGMFNIMTAEMFRAVWEAARETRSPVIIGTSEGMAKFIGAGYAYALAKAAAKDSDIPVALHLDHATNMDIVHTCVDAGYTSVMRDASKSALEENIHLTQEAVSLSRPKGITVEGELGRIGGTEDVVSVSEREAAMTIPDEAGRFAAETGVDCLAVSIGNAHGLYKGEPELDFDRMAAIQSAVTTSAPGCTLVLHGGTGIPDDDIRRAISMGIRKVNIATELQIAFMNTARSVFESDPKVYDPRKVLGPGLEAMKTVTKEKMELFGSAGRAESLAAAS